MRPARQQLPHHVRVPEERREAQQLKAVRRERARQTRVRVQKGAEGGELPRRRLEGREGRARLNELPGDVGLAVVGVTGSFWEKRTLRL